MEISSTYIRVLLLDGNVPLANKLLGYPYEITSVVEHGQQHGTAAARYQMIKLFQHCIHAFPQDIIFSYFSSGVSGGNIA